MSDKLYQKMLDLTYNQAIEDAAKHVELSLPPITGDSIRKLKRNVGKEEK